MLLLLEGSNQYNSEETNHYSLSKKTHGGYSRGHHLWLLAKLRVLGGRW